MERKEGYYWVKIMPSQHVYDEPIESEIAFWCKEQGWSLVGTASTYYDHDFTYISKTPIKEDEPEQKINY